MYKRDGMGRFSKGTSQPHGFPKGNVPWNKNKKTGQIPSSAFRKGHKTWDEGLTKSTDYRVKGISERMKIDNPMFDLKILEKMRISRKGQFVLDKHPNWKGGKSFELYSMEFNNELKKEIIQRDNYSCQFCGWDENVVKHLVVHHLDENKRNNISSNLLSLCRSCHTKFHRSGLFCFP